MELGMRIPLPEGHSIQMENGAVYTIKKVIGSGTFSLVYDVVSDGGTVPQVIKEFYPVGVAKRDENGNVVPDEGCDSIFYHILALFRQEAELSGDLSALSYQILGLEYIIGNYAVMKRWSTDMVSVKDLVEQWQETDPLPSTGDKKDIDPVFPDLVRTDYALRVTESLLSVLSVVHEYEYLHMDISYNNVVWAGQDLRTGRDCEVILADFGSAIKTENGCCETAEELYTTRAFRAPEAENRKTIRRLTAATDLHAVGILLYYLCTGSTKLGGKQSHSIQRHLEYQSIPDEFREKLSDLIAKAVAQKPEDRYQSADEMKKDVRALRDMIPVHPVNPSYTSSFTLKSLRSMLEGSRTSRYSWAHELSRRRRAYYANVPSVSIPSEACDPITNQVFANDMDFLKQILPNEIFHYIETQINQKRERAEAVEAFMAGQYDYTWRNEICRLFQRYGTRSLLVISRGLLNHEGPFLEDQKLFIQLMGTDGRRLRDISAGQPPYVGLAAMIVYALLGSDAFRELVPGTNREEIAKFFYQID